MDIDDEDDDNHIVSADAGADGIYTVDLTRFRSWLTREVMKNDIVLKLGSDEYTFATVYTKSLVASYDVSADYEEGTLTWLSDIIGAMLLSTGLFMVYKALIVLRYKE